MTVFMMPPSWATETSIGSDMMMMFESLNICLMCLYRVLCMKWMQREIDLWMILMNVEISMEERGSYDSTCKCHLYRFWLTKDSTKY